MEAQFLGRTFCQFTSRSAEGSAGVGTITIKNCKVRDTGLAPGDDHKGGTAFTFGGNHNGAILIENCTYQCGFGKLIKTLTKKGSPYGTGALVMIADGAAPTARLHIKDCTFQFAKDCGDRPVVSIGGCRDLLLTGKTSILAGAYGVALDLDPVWDNGKLKSPLNGKVRLTKSVQVNGKVQIRGKEANDSQVKLLRGGF